MTQDKGFLDGLVATVKKITQEMGLSDLEEQPVSEPKTETAEETISQKDYVKLRQAYGRLEQGMDGYKARLQREHEQAVYRAESKALGAAFTALDALEGALRYLESSQDAAEVKRQIAAGLVLQRTNTLDYLARNFAVIPISSVGSPADPQYHHVVSEIPSEQPKGVIVYIVEVGYTRNGTVIREAKVVVAK